MKVGLVVRLAAVFGVAAVVALFPRSMAVASAATNGRIVYACSSGICSVNPDGTGVHVLAPSGVEPSCSPDGHVVLYAASGGIWEVNADGSDRHLAVSGGAMPSISWSGIGFVYTETAPDDKSVNFWSFATGQQSSAAPGGAISYPQLSPSGSQVLWGNGTFRTADRNGSHVQIVHTGALSVYYPAFTPNGQILAVGSDGQIHRFNVDGSDLTTLTAVSDDPNGVASSPDGNDIAYGANDGLFVVPATGGPATQIVSAEVGATSWCGVPTTAPGGSGGASERVGGARSASKCMVPLLKGKTLDATGRALTRANCRLGKVKRRKSKHPHRRLRVISQGQRPHAKLPAAARVSVTLG